MRSFIVASFIAGSLLTTTAAFAQQRPPRQAPQEALDACQGSSEGAACAFTSPRGEVTGECRTPPKEEQLACVPERGSRRGGGEEGEERQRGRR